MKEYIVSATHKNGATIHIGAYCDCYGNTPFRIYYCGQDTGRRYATLGHASWYIQKVAKDWRTDKVSKGTADTIPIKGTPHNVKMYKYWYVK